MGIPWVKFYFADFLNGVSDLKPNEIAVYIIVLARIYDTDGPISNDPEKIARRCNMRKPQCQSAIDSLIEEGKLFVVDGCLDNERSQKERAKRFEMSSKQSENVLKRHRNKTSSEHEATENFNENNDGAIPSNDFGITDDIPTRTKTRDHNQKEIERVAPNGAAQTLEVNLLNFEPDPKPKPKKRKQAIDPEYALSPAQYTWAMERDHSVEKIEAEFEKFKNYWQSRGDPMADWDACFRNWMIKSEDYARSR